MLPGLECILATALDVAQLALACTREAASVIGRIVAPAYDTAGIKTTHVLDDRF